MINFNGHNCEGKPFTTYFIYNFGEIVLKLITKESLLYLSNTVLYLPPTELIV